MSKRGKSITGYLNITLALLLMLVLYKIGGSALVMIFLTLGIAFGAIYLSGESFTGIFRKRIDVSSLEELRRLDPYEFEKVVGDYFRDCGYTVQQTKRTGDGGKDLIMYKNGQTYYVEVKRYGKGNPVSRPLIQKLVGACHPVGAKGIFITTSRFTKEAIAEAHRSGIQLIDGDQFIRLLKS
jgi:HJR/Mrr/RecB family endonuclease